MGSEASSERWIESSDGTRIFTRTQAAAGPARANVVICHGFNAHSGLYAWSIDRFADHGFDVTALDLRGRGKSDGERFYVESIDEYVADVSAAVEDSKARNPGLPTYLLGHSAGGVTCCVYALDHQDRIDGLICEDFAFKTPAPDIALKLIEGASHLFPHTHVLKLPNEAFSRDTHWVSYLNSDPLIEHEVQPVQTVAALARATERLAREFDHINLPVLILHGTADKVTEPEGSRQFFDSAGSTDKTLKLYDGHFHDLLNDLGREQVMDDILAWIDNRAGQAVRAEMPMAT